MGDSADDPPVIEPTPQSAEVLADLECARRNASECLFASAELIEIACAGVTTSSYEGTLHRLSAAFREASRAIHAVYGWYPRPANPVAIAGCPGPRYHVAAVEVARRILDGAANLNHPVALCRQCAEQWASDGKLAKPVKKSWAVRLASILGPHSQPQDFVEWLRAVPPFDAAESFSYVQLEFEAARDAVIRASAADDRDEKPAAERALNGGILMGALADDPPYVEGFAMLDWLEAHLGDPKVKPKTAVVRQLSKDVSRENDDTRTYPLKRSVPSDGRRTSLQRCRNNRLLATDQRLSPCFHREL